MPSLLYTSCDSDDFKKSSENIDPGLYYASTYYEDEPIYSDILEPPDESASKEKTTLPVIPPIKIQENLVTNIELPPILWHGFDIVPKILNVSNTGQTILINGQWPNGRPYIEGGPLNGTYIFSQIHFHSPSEHEIAGKRFPLEMHVVHYKTSYLTQERAMHEKDGTVVLVYLFEVVDKCPSGLSSVTKLAPQIEKVNSKTETKNVALDQIVQPFTSNYYVYWGSVSTEKNSYLLQWIINGCILFLTSEEAEDLLSVMNFEDITSKQIPRMKPQNDRIFYIKEVANEEKELVAEKVVKVEKEKVVKEDAEVQAFKEETKVKKCDTGVQSDKEFWPLKSCYKCGSNIVCEVAKDKDSAAMELLIGDEDEICDSKSNCKVIKSFSGLRGNLCYQKKKEKPVKSKTCVTQTDFPIKELCDCKETKSNEKQVQKVCVGLQEKPSCRSVSTDTEPPPVSSDEAPVIPVQPVESVKSVENKVDSCKPNVVVNCPSKKKTCERKSKGKNKKSAESCKVEVTLSSSGSECPSKEREKKKRKQRSEVQKTCSGRKIKKTVPVRKPKKKVKEKNNCDNEPTSSNRSESSRESVRERRKKHKNKSKYEKEIPVECRVATVTKNNFESALTDYSIMKLDDVKALTMEDKFPMESFPDSKCKEMIAVLKSSFHSDRSNGFTTLYEKKRNIKVPELSKENCAINVLLSPANMRQNTSCFVLNSKTDSEEVKCPEPKESPDIPNLTVEKIACTEVEEPESTSTDSKKEFCVHVDLLFRSKNEDVSECLAQEYNLTLIYNQNILQEYRGILHPSTLELGSYEKLELLPKYPELDNINVKLQDCTVKMESLDEISMRAKFLLKEINLKDGEVLTEFTGTSERKIVTVIDADTQYSFNEIDKLKEDAVLDVHKSKQNEKLPENKQKNELSFIECERSVSKTSLNIAKHDNQTLKNQKSHSQLILENFECKEKSVKNADVYLEEACKKTVFNSVEQSTDSKNKELRDKSLTKESYKELKESSNKKKTVYFMYEKIEKDKNSGKKIFVGSFRSKYDLKNFSNEKKLKSNEPIGNNEGNEEKLLLFPNNNTTDELLEHTSTEKELKIISPISSKNLCSKRNMVTLHKYRSKPLGISCSKKEHLNLVVGKVMKLQNESKGFRRLANLVGIDKRRSPKISIYELEKPSENYNFPSTSETTRREFLTDFSNQSFSTNSEFKLYKRSKSKKCAPSYAKAACNEDFPKHLSKSAVIVIPVEVESMSKIEVILVEHNDSFKRSAQKPEREIIPCLNYGE